MINNNQSYNGTAVGAMIYKDPYAEEQSTVQQYHPQPATQPNAQFGPQNGGQAYNPFAPQNFRQPNQQFNPQFNQYGQGNQQGPNGPAKKKQIIIGSAVAAAIVVIFGIAIAFAHKNTKGEASTDNPFGIETAEAATEEEASQSRVTGYTSNKQVIFSGDLVHVDGLSDECLSEEFAMDGQVYHLPFAYSDISNQYSYDLRDNMFVETDVLNPEEQISCVVKMEKPNMDNGIYFTAGFENPTKVEQNIKDSKVYAIDVDVTWAKSENYPEIVLPKGITWGCTLDDVVTAYGEPSHSYRSDINGYWEYTYEDGDFDYSMRLTVYDDRGITGIALHSYKAD